MKEIIIEVPDRFGKTLKPEKVNTEIKGELVRCKDCDYYESWNKQKICMQLGEWYGRVPEDWFCAGGKRKIK